MVSFKGICQSGLVVLMWGSVVIGSGIGFAEEPTQPAVSPPSQREQQLREQLKGILQELDDLQKEREKALPPSEQPRPSATEKVTPEQAEIQGIHPEYELADTSIVSSHLQKRPEGISLSATIPAETDSQPTRTMKESIESLPGIVLRQANGPRDFSISIRGEGKGPRPPLLCGISRSMKTGSSKPNRTDSRVSIYMIRGSCAAPK
jgi:iron complex outermembrane receptor protein